MGVSPESEVWADIIFGLVAISIPLALSIAWLDLQDVQRASWKLTGSRALTRIGWSLSVGSIAYRSVRSGMPPVEHGPLWLMGVFSVGVIFSSVGFLGIARSYHNERVVKGGET